MPFTNKKDNCFDLCGLGHFNFLVLLNLSSIPSMLLNKKQCSISWHICRRLLLEKPYLVQDVPPPFLFAKFPLAYLHECIELSLPFSGNVLC